MGTRKIQPGKQGRDLTSKYSTIGEINGNLTHFFDDHDVNAYKVKFTDLQKQYFQNITGVAFNRTQKHHRVVMNFLEPVLARKSKKQAVEIMTELAKLTKSEFGDALGNLVNISKELHTKDINAVHNLLQRYTSLQGIKQEYEFAPNTIRTIKWRGKEVKVGNLLLDGQVENLTRFVGGQSGMSLEFIDMISKEKDSKKVAKILAGYMDTVKPQFDGAIAAAVYLSDNPKITLEHKKQVMRKLGPEAQVYMDDFIGFIEQDTAKVLSGLRQQVDKLSKAGSHTPLDLQKQIDDNLKLQGLVEGYRNRLKTEPLPYKEATAARAAQQVTDTGLNISKFQFEDFKPPPGTAFQGGDAAALAWNSNANLGRNLFGGIAEDVAKLDSAASNIWKNSVDNASVTLAENMSTPLLKGWGWKKAAQILPYAMLPLDYVDINDRQAYIKEKGERNPEYIGSSSHEWDLRQLNASKASAAAGSAGAATTLTGTLTLDPELMAIGGLGTATNAWIGTTNLLTDVYRNVFEEDKRAETGELLRGLYGSTIGRFFEEKGEETPQITGESFPVFDTGQSTEDTEEGV